MAFTDKFSRVADAYAAQRPRYPAALYSWLATLAPGHELAWDCATGNGQAALALSDHFAQVAASDASAEMIASATSHERVAYRVAAAEDAGFLEDESVDLVTVAQAVHWFDFEQFYAGVRRVLKEDGVIALWAYAGSSVSGEIDAVTSRLNREILRDYWSPRVELVNDAYRDLPFPFRECPAPELFMNVDWTLAEFLDYHRTWSAAVDYRRARGACAVDLIAGEIASCWGDAEARRRVSWRLILKVGRKAGGR